MRVPVPQALDDMRGLVDELILVPDDGILRAMRLLHRHAGVVAEPSGAAGLAAVMQVAITLRGDKRSGRSSAVAISPRRRCETGSPIPS